MLAQRLARVVIDLEPLRARGGGWVSQRGWSKQQSGRHTHEIEGQNVQQLHEQATLRARRQRRLAAANAEQLVLHARRGYQSVWAATAGKLRQ